MTTKRTNKATAVVLLCLIVSAVAPAAWAQKSVTLARSSPEQQGIASADLLAFIEAADKEIDTMNSFMLVRHGHVVS